MPCCFLLSVAASAKTPLEPVLQSFVQNRPDLFFQQLLERGPAPVGPEARDAIVRTLPPQGEVKELSALQRKKLDSLTRILDIHGRGSVYVVKVIAVPQAIVALHARCILLISEAGLAIWSSEELQALAAHEIGHEYVWDEYYDARAGNRQEELQQIELYCDGISILTLTAAGVDPSNLSSALKRGICYNRSRLGAARNEDNYPNFSRRARFHQVLVEWIAESCSDCKRAH